MRKYLCPKGEHDMVEAEELRHAFDLMRCPACQYRSVYMSLLGNLSKVGKGCDGPMACVSR